MFFANPWGLLGLLALPAIAVIHLYHRRFPPLLVAGAHLWGLQQETQSAGRRRDRLPITPSLLLELLAALLIALLLADPRLGEANAARHLIVVLDNSASMQARDIDDVSFRDIALAELRSRSDELGRSALYTIIHTGRRPTMLAGPAVRWDEAEPSLAAWVPSEGRHDFAPAWDLASQLSENGGEVLFLTDHLPSAETPVPPRMETVSVGSKRPNLAFTAARWTFDSVAAEGRVYLRLRNFGTQPATARLTAKTPAAEVLSSDISLGVDEERPSEFVVPGGLGELSITITAPADALPLDSTVRLIEPKSRIVHTSITLPKESITAERVADVLAAFPDLQPADSPETAELLFGPAGTLPPSRPGLWWLGIGPINPDESALENSKAVIGPYLMEKQHPLLEDVILGGIVWGGIQPVDAPLAPLVSAGSNMLLGRLDGSQTTGYLMNIDLARSNITESPDWPILLANLVDLRRAALPGLRQWNYRIDEAVSFRLFEGPSEDEPAATRPLTLIHPSRTRTLARTAIVEVPPLETVGIYTVQDGDRPLGRFAVNLIDSEESDLTALLPGERKPSEAAVSAESLVDRSFTWIIIIGLMMIAALILLDWFVLRGRRA